MGILKVFVLCIVGPALVVAMSSSDDWQGAKANNTSLGQPEMGPVTPLVAPGGARSPERPPKQPDVVIASISFSAGGQVKYVVQNRGQTGTDGPFVVDVYIDGVRKDTVKHTALPGLSQQAVQSSLARSESCQASNLRVVADSQSVIAEADESNNAYTRATLPPCPDLVIALSQDRMNNNLEYKAKVTITNRGNLAAGAFDVVVTGGPDGYLGSLPILLRRRISALSPGQSTSFEEDGKHLVTTTFWYHVFADPNHDVKESNEDNNTDKRTFGPH